MQISVARALQDLKRTDDKINKAIQQSAFIGLMVGGKSDTGKTKDELSSGFKSSMDSINDLIKHRAEVKAAIVQSNATTMVDLPIFGKTTVAQAIEYKSMIHIQNSLIQAMQGQYTKVHGLAQQRNRENEDRVQSLVESALGSDAKKTGDEYDAIAKPYLERYKVDVIDPLNMHDLIMKKRDEIEDFVSNVDYILSESNALTMINV